MRHWQLRDQNSRSSQRRAHARCCAVTPVHVILEARDLNNRDPSRYLLRERGPYPVPEFQVTHDRRSSLRHTLTLIMRNKFFFFFFFLPVVGFFPPRPSHPRPRPSRPRPHPSRPRPGRSPRPSRRKRTRDGNPATRTSAASDEVHLYKCDVGTPKSHWCRGSLPTFTTRVEWHAKELSVPHEKSKRLRVAKSRVINEYPAA